MNTTDTLPIEPGFYWAIMRKADPGTTDGDESVSGDWEVVDVFENCIDPNDPEHLAVFVPGIEKGQSLGNFEWGPRVEMSHVVRPVTEITTTELGLPAKGVDLNKWIEGEIERVSPSEGCPVIGRDEAAEIARGAALQVIADRETLIRNLRQSGYTVIEPGVYKRTSNFDFFTHLVRQRQWSEHTFGPGPRTVGVCDHIRKELAEIENDPTDITEWIDVVILGLDGAWRAGASPQEIIDTLTAKHAKNEARVWPDWRTADPNKAIEHDRSHDDA